ALYLEGAVRREGLEPTTHGLKVPCSSSPRAWASTESAVRELRAVSLHLSHFSKEPAPDDVCFRRPVPAFPQPSRPDCRHFAGTASTNPRHRRRPPWHQPRPHLALPPRCSGPSCPPACLACPPTSTCPHASGCK